MTPIRRSCAADLPLLLDIWRRSVRATHGFLSEADFTQIERQVANDYLPQAGLWVAELEGRALGFMGLCGAHVDALFIDPERHGQGLGRAMLSHAAGLAGKLSVDVNEQNTHALAFYARMGFRRSGRSPLDAAGRPYPLLHLCQP